MSAHGELVEPCGLCALCVPGRLLHRHLDVGVGPAALEAAAAVAGYVVRLGAEDVLARCGECDRCRRLAVRGLVDLRPWIAEADLRRSSMQRPRECELGPRG